MRSGTLGMVRCMTAVSLPLLSVGAALIIAPVFVFGCAV